jgi:rhodanese-related sulfurtransferase
MNALRPNQMAAWIAQVMTELPPGVLPVVLDVREAWEVQTASVKPDGFELVHMPMQTIPARLQDLPRDRPIACLCHHGGRSAQVTQFLNNQGFEQAVNIAGGINAWAIELDTSVPRY